MHPNLAEAAVVVSFREGALAAEACPVDEAEALQRAAEERCEFLCLRYVRHMRLALRAADDLRGTGLPNAASAGEIVDWVGLQLDDAERDDWETRWEDAPAEEGSDGG